MRLVLIRGLPGSGKTTLAKHLAEKLHMVHFEADQYFEDEVTGEYKFDPSSIGEAHDYCMEATAAALDKHLSVVVSNTFTTRKEMMPYFKMADKYGLKVDVIECKEDFGSIHHVPKHIVERMKQRWEN